MGGTNYPARQLMFTRCLFVDSLYITHISETQLHLWRVRYGTRCSPVGRPQKGQNHHGAKILARSILGRPTLTYGGTLAHLDKVPFETLKSFEMVLNPGGWAREGRRREDLKHSINTGY